MTYEGDGIRRRELLVAAGATGLVLASPLNLSALARQKKLPNVRDGKFLHGVSSGLPSPRAITLWTRVSEIGQTARLTLEVARDRKFRRVVHRRRVVAQSSRDFTVHALVKNLKPGTQYFYRFYTRNQSSRVGRFRTMPPPDSRQPVKIGFFSCQNYEVGYYTAHAALAKEKDLDLVVCLGDYMYENHKSSALPDRLDATGENQDGNSQTLAEYHQKYRLYQSDPNLQAMHAAHPFVAIWDDHEVENNAGRGQTSAQPDPALDPSGRPRRVPYEARRRNGYNAFFDAMPRTRFKAGRNRIFGSLRLGRMAELFVTDQRQYRDPQACNNKILVTCPESEEPGRTMLGPNQKTWFKKAVVDSKARWKIWGSQLMVMSLDLPKGNHLNPDQWDGYIAERQEIIEHFRDNGVKNLAVVSGDVHAFFAGSASATGNDTSAPFAPEFTTGSLTSEGLSDKTGLPSESILEMIPEFDPHIQWADLDRKGYGILSCRQNELICTMKGPLTVREPGAAVTTLAKFRVKAGSPAIEVI